MLWIKSFQSEWAVKLANIYKCSVITALIVVCSFLTNSVTVSELIKSTVPVALPLWKPQLWRFYKAGVCNFCFVCCVAQWCTLESWSSKRGPCPLRWRAASMACTRKSLPTLFTSTRASWVVSHPVSVALSQCPLRNAAVLSDRSSSCQAEPHRALRTHRCWDWKIACISCFSRFVDHFHIHSDKSLHWLPLTPSPLLWCLSFT